MSLDSSKITSMPELLAGFRGLGMRLLAGLRHACAGYGVVMGAKLFKTSEGLCS
jgi:hypothetical protein